MVVANLTPRIAPGVPHYRRVTTYRLRLHHLIADSLAAFHQQASPIADLPPEIEAMRRTAARRKSAHRWRWTQKINEFAPTDARDVWVAAGNSVPQSLVDMSQETFLSNVQRLSVEEA